MYKKRYIHSKTTLLLLLLLLDYNICLEEQAHNTNYYARHRVAEGNTDRHVGSCGVISM